MKLNYMKLLAIFVIAIILRLFFAFAYPQLPVERDALGYDTYGWNAASGKGFVTEDGSPMIEASPGYPFFLAWIYRIFGHSYGHVKFFQILVSLFILLFIFVLARDIFGDRVAFLSVFIGAVYPPFLSYNGLLLTETIFTFCIVSFMYFAWLAIKEKKKFFFFLAGLIIGCGVLVREEAIVFLPAFLLIGLIYFRKDFKKIILLVLVAICVVTPWTIRNYKIFNKFVLVSSQGGSTLWISSYKEEWLEWHHKDPYFANLTRGLNSLEAADLLRKKGLENIKEHPLLYVRFCFKRLVRFWIGSHSNTFYGLEDSFASYIHTGAFLKVVIKIVLLIVNTLLVCLGFHGIFKALKKIPEKRKEIIFLLMPILLIMVVHFFLFATTRYQVPIMPFMIIFASYAGLYLCKLASIK